MGLPRRCPSSFVLLSLKGMGSNSPTPSLFVPMKADTIVGISRLLTAEGAPFNRLVTSVTVAEGLAWTVSGSMQPYAEFPSVVFNDLVIGYDVWQITLKGQPWAWAHDSDWGHPYKWGRHLHAPWEKCNSVERINIPGRTGRIMRCPVEADMLEAKADAAEALQEVNKAKVDAPFLAKYPQEIGQLRYSIEENTKRGPVLLAAAAEKAERLPELDKEIAKAHKDRKTAAAKYDKSIRNLDKWNNHTQMWLKDKKGHRPVQLHPESTQLCIQHLHEQLNHL